MAARKFRGEPDVYDLCCYVDGPSAIGTFDDRDWYESKHWGAADSWLADSRDEPDT